MNIIILLELDHVNIKLIHIYRRWFYDDTQKVLNWFSCILHEVCLYNDSILMNSNLNSFSEFNHHKSSIKNQF